MSSPSYNYTSWFSNERTMEPGLFVYSTRPGLPQVRHTRNFSIELRIYRRTWPRVSWNSFRNRSCVCACRLCRSANQTTLLYILYTQHYLLRPAYSTSVFCVRTGNRAKDSRTADHTRNHRARPRRCRLRTSRLRQTPSAPQSIYIYTYNVGTYIYYIPKSTARSFLLYIFFSLRRNIPIIHGCGTETETHLRLRVLIIFISSCRLIIIPSSARASTLTHTNGCNGSATARS